MSTINHALRSSILETLGKDRLTSKEIASRLHYVTDFGIRSALRAMHKAGAVDFTKSYSEKYHPLRWWAT